MVTGIQQVATANIPATLTGITTAQIPAPENTKRASDNRRVSCLER